MTAPSAPAAAVGPLDGAAERVDELVGDGPAGWDLAGALPVELLRELGKAGLLCAEVPAEHGGLAASSVDAGRFTAHVGSRCSSLRSVLTSQAMAAWTVRRLGSAEQRAARLPELAGGALAAVAFSEAGAGSDLSAMTTEVRTDGAGVVVTGRKVWTTAARYADLVVVVGRYGPDGAAAVLVPADAPGVTVLPVGSPSGCRAAGHADVVLDGVRLPASAVLGGGGQPLSMLVTTALAAGRMSVAWGCVGILRACLAAAGRHAATREQFGRRLAEHQLVAGHLADLLVAEQLATRACEHASRCWDAGSPEVVMATVLAKHVGATEAVRGAAAAARVLGSAAARDGHVIARAHRDARLMELIEGSSEICRLLLAEHAVAAATR